MKKKELVFREVGKILVNFGYLVFTGIVISTILRGEHDRQPMLIIGCCITFLLIAGGMFCLMNGGE
jgi:hypothetical protein